MEGIVIGVDESEGAAEALRWGTRHAELHQRPCTAVMSWSYRDQHQLDPGAPFDLAYGRTEAVRDLDAIVDRALADPPPWLVREVTCRGAISELLAASLEADLVVVGARGMGGFSTLLLGSVSREVVAAAACPVAVVRAPGDPDGPIVVGVDGSTMSRRAVRWALEEARIRHRPLVALSAWHRGTNGEHPPSGHADHATMAERARRLLDREISDRDVADLEIERRVEAGPPAAALVDASRTASMVVVGARGQRPAARLMLGSVSDQVSHHATCPVVVMPWTARDVPRTADPTHRGRRAGGAGQRDRSSRHSVR